MPSHFTRFAFLTLLALVAMANAEGETPTSPEHKHIQELQTILESSKADLSKCQTELAQSTEKHSTVKRELEQKLSELHEAKDQLAAHFSQELETQVESLTKQLDEQKTLLDDTKSGLEKEVENYKSLLEDANTLSKKRGEELEEAHARLDELMGQKTYVNFTAISKDVTGWWRGLTGGNKKAKADL